MKYKIKELTKTCGGCPSQWEGKLENGKMMYVRYRWGCLDVTISENLTNDIDDAVMGKLIFQKYIGGNYDGVMENNKLISILKNFQSDCKIKNINELIKEKRK